MRLCLFRVGVEVGVGFGGALVLTNWVGQGASCNTNKFINSVESVRPKKSAIYGLVWMLNVI